MESLATPSSELEESVTSVLKDVLDVTRVLRRKRAKSGYLNLEIGEPSIVLGEDGQIRRARQGETRGPPHD